MLTESSLLSENALPVLAVIAVLGGVIFFHELGHFLAAKYFRVGVKTFSLGFGPKIIGFTRGNTNYQLAALPLGGYVSMVGEQDPADIPAPFSLSDSFAVRPAWQRLIIVAAGPAFNILLTLILYAGLFFVQGQNYLLPEVGNIRPDYPAQQAGIQQGDTIVSINDLQVSRWDTILTTVSASEGAALKLIIMRDNALHTVHLTPKPFARKTLLGETVNSWAIGIGPSGASAVQQFSLGEAIAQSARHTWFITTLIGENIVKLFERTAPLDSVGGPIRLVSEIHKNAAEYGATGMLLAAAFISLNLGLLNLLPIPMLDGGHIIFFTVELIRGKPAPERFLDIMARIGITLLLALMIFATYNDIAQWIFPKAP